MTANYRWSGHTDYGFISYIVGGAPLSVALGGVSTR